VDHPLGYFRFKKPLRNAFQDQGRRAPSAVADARRSVPGVFLLEDVQQGDQNPGATGSQRMAQGNGTAVHVAAIG
jgi:hypothetical protein